jgi:RsiW-degrading membrane proteinase PrsW (M82 family)
MRKQSVNLWAVLVCVVISQIVPALWYGAFSDTWIALNGFTTEQVESANSPAPYLARIVASSFSAYTLAWIFTKIPVKSLVMGFLIGMLFGVVFVLSALMVKDMFSLRPLLLSLIDGGAQVLVYAISGAILGAWRKYE